MFSKLFRQFVICGVAHVFAASVVLKSLFVPFFFLSLFSVGWKYPHLDFLVFLGFFFPCKDVEMKV